MKPPIKLAPCPFCQSDEVSFDERIECICCDNCGCLGPCNRQRHKKRIEGVEENKARRYRKAISSWNARTDPMKFIS